MGKESRIRWTNKSVRAFAGDKNPIEVIQAAARSLVLKARENGWEGPPFNPLKLAELLKVQVIANANITDARVFAAANGPRIEFNPQLPRERMRFSIAHELAHMLFPDWQEEVRNRSYHQTGDHWQLEMLCNLAASEFVLPIGSLPSSVEISPIEELMTQRRSFDVSTEAFLMRIARIAETPIGVFFATRKEDSADNPEYRVDYLFHMAMKDSWPLIQRHGLLPTNKLLELFEIDETRVEELTQKRRPTSVLIEHAEHGQATVRDQIPLHEKDLVKCLTGGLTPLDWYRRLNERVFFWLTEQRLLKLLCAGAYRNLEHLVLKVPTRPIIEKYRDRIELSPMNSGCTKPMPHPRGADTFLPIDEYPYDFWKKVRRRPRGERVVELTIIGGVPDIQEYVVEASIRSCAGKYEMFYTKP